VYYNIVKYICEVDDIEVDVEVEGVTGS